MAFESDSRQPLTSILLVANSTPIVDFDSKLNSFLVKRERRLDLPTPESPIRTTATKTHGSAIKLLVLSLYYSRIDHKDCSVGESLSNLEIDCCPFQSADILTYVFNTNYNQISDVYMNIWTFKFQKYVNTKNKGICYIGYEYFYVRDRTMVSKRFSVPRQLKLYLQYTL